MNIRNLDHLVLMVDSVDATIVFYERLGMRHDYGTRPHGAA